LLHTHLFYRESIPPNDIFASQGSNLLGASVLYIDIL